jgi:enediyne biosynthesis protein E4
MVLIGMANLALHVLFAEYVNSFSKDFIPCLQVPGVVHVARILIMLAILAAGSWWLHPREQVVKSVEVSFVERASESGCVNQHTMVKLSDKFANIMPWLSSVGAAAAAADYDNDGFADIYVTNSGRGDTNRLFQNRGNGTFEDVTSAAGVECGNPQGASMHAVWGDVDNDGRLDMYVVKWAEPNQLFRQNDGGKFTDISKDAGVDYWGYGNGATSLDYDRDGRLDLLVGNYFAETVIDQKTGQPVRNDLWHPRTTRIMHETFTHARNGGRNVLYHNVSEPGTVRFEEFSEAVGLTRGGWALSVGSGDLNNDGWPDLYIANDFGPDELYLNTGATEDPPRFRIVVDPKGHPGVGNDWWKGMNVDIGDVNNDGYLDIYVTNILERSYKTDEGNMLWLNCADASCPGGRGFRNLGEATGTHDGGWGWGGKFADFNNDGLMDIFTVNGFVTGDLKRNYWFAIQEMVTQTKNQTADARDWPVMGDRDLSGRDPSRLFMQQARREEGNEATRQRGNEAGSRQSRNDIGHETIMPEFVEVARQSGITDTYNGRGIAIADFNHDGFLDMYIANQGALSTYYVNEGSKGSPHSGGFLWLKLTGRPDLPVTIGGRTLASTADAVGARVTVTTDRGQMVREVQGGMGFASQSEHAVHFGIPGSTTIRSITIRWPSGRVREFDGDAAQALLNKHTHISEVEDIAQSAESSR